MSIERQASLAILANLLSEILSHSAAHARTIIHQLPADLHSDAMDVVANVAHFVADADIRQRDEDYKKMQETQMRQLIDALQRDEPREQLLRYTFLTS